MTVVGANLNVAFNINEVDLNWYVRNAIGSDLLKGTNSAFLGRAFPDVFYVEASFGGEHLEARFGGTGITENASGAITAGTITGFTEYSHALKDNVWYVLDASVSAVAIYQAATTQSNSDELSLIGAALSGNDTITLSNQADVMNGYDGNDVINGLAGNDQLFGGGGDDIIDGGQGADIIYGGLGNDTIDPGLGADRVYGEEGNDLIRFSEVMSSNVATPIGLIDGGTGIDTLDLSNLSPSTLGTIQNGTGQYVAGMYVGSQKFELANLEVIRLGWSDNYVSLDGNQLPGVAIYAGAGADNVYLTGSKTLYAEDGDDRVMLTGSYGTTTLGFASGGNGYDTLMTNIGATLDIAAGTLIMGQGRWNFTGFENYILSAPAGYRATAYGDAADNTISVSSAANSLGGVTIYGRGGSDKLSGSLGADYLDGGAGDDRLDAGAGRDTIFGDSGDDTIIGVADGDTLNGGDGIDTLIYSGLARGYHVYQASGGTVVGNADFVTNVETIEFRDAVLTYDVDSNAAYVMRLYHGALDREPDAQGLDYWMDLMAAGMTRKQVAEGFFSAPAFSGTAALSNGDFIDFLYQQTLGWPSDPNGKQYWLNQLASGQTRVDLVMGFSESTAHRAMTASTLAKGLWVTDNNFQLVEAFYDALSDRLPDQNGLVYWVNQLESGVTGKQVAAGFTSSPEFSSNTAGFTNGQLVDYMYQTTLGRAADADGKDYWVNDLMAGMTKAELFYGFATSFEHYQQIETHLYSGVDYYVV